MLETICLQFLLNSVKIMVVFQDLPQNRLTEILDKAFSVKNSFFDAGNGCILPQKYRDISEKVKNLKIRDDDVFLCSFPRTGSTWMQEILWLLGNDLDFEKAQSTIQQVHNNNNNLEMSSILCFLIILSFDFRYGIL